jgi:hypothetical protein
VGAETVFRIDGLAALGAESGAWLLPVVWRRGRGLTQGQHLRFDFGVQIGSTALSRQGVHLLQYCHAFGYVALSL